MTRLLPMLLVLTGCVTGARSTASPSPGATASSGSGARAPAGDEGLASWYGKQFAGKQTANGEIFDPGGMTAAHRTMKFGTCVKVELLSTGKTVEVRINDRGPFIKDRIIDLSEEAARQLGILDEGVGKVRLSGCG